MAEEGSAPAGASNPGGNHRRSSLEDLNRELHLADRDHAREVVRAVIGSAILHRFLEAPRGDLPIGILDRDTQVWLGAATHLVRLPDRIVYKQKGRWAKKRKGGGRQYPGHDLTTAAYSLLPRLIERPALVLRFKPAWPSLDRDHLARRLNLVSEVGGVFYNSVVGRFPGDPARVSLISFHPLDRGERRVRAMIEQAETGLDGQRVFLDTFEFAPTAR